MTVGPAPERAQGGAGPTHSHTGLSRWAVGLAGTGAIMTGIAFAAFGVAYAIGGASATEDNWVGALTAFSLLGGLMTSLTGFALAVVARIKHERRTLLWLPLSVFPALLAFLVLGEAFWWE